MDSGTRPAPTEVLIIDDDETILEVLSELFRVEGYLAETCADSAEAIGRLQVKRFDVVVTDLNLPGSPGTVIVREALAANPSTVIIVITGAASISSAVQCMKLGAYDFLPKPFELADLLHVVEDGLSAESPGRIAPQAPEQKAGDDRVIPDLIGVSESMREILELIEVVARSKSTVMITGETGTGKELVARAIHQQSPRSQARLVSLNCAAIPENLLEDELFGHVKGAYTGAQSNRSGRFELAHRGTLFLDEIGYMSPALQVKLLRVLQEREFERLGGTQTIKCDVRIIAATSANLERLINEGSFRRDLYYRLNVIPIDLPPLRRRREDVPLLAQHFVHRHCMQAGIPPKLLTPATMKKLVSYDWPGNVRELENVLERAVVLSRSREQILPSDLPGEVQNIESPSVLDDLRVPDDGLCFETVVSNVERTLILQSLQKTNGNKSLAAELLKMKRTTLVEKLKRLNLESDSRATVSSA